MANLNPELTEKLSHLFADTLSNWDNVLILLLSNDGAKLDFVVEVLKHLSKSQINECDDKGRTALAIAASRGRVDIVCILLHHHASVDIKDEDGHYPIHHAASAGSMDIVRLLLAGGASVKAKTKSGETALHFACANGHVDVVRVLLSYGAEVNVFDDDNYTPLKGAARSGSAEVVELLIKHGAEVDKVRGNGCICTPLIMAAHEGHVDVMRILLDNHAAIDRPGDRHGTALYRACQEGHEGAVELLLSRKARLESHDDDDGWTPLIMATDGGHEGILRLLLKSGANVDAIDKDGWSSLFLASRCGHEGVVHLLLNSGATFNMTNNKGVTPLAIASIQGFSKIVESLLERHAEVNIIDEEGMTPLTEASFYGNLNAATLLLKHGAKITMSDNDGRTSLHRASHQGHDGLVKLLLDHNAPVNATDNSGWTPLHMASSNSLADVDVRELPESQNMKEIYLQSQEARIASAQYDQVVELLLKAQANVKMKTEKGETALHLALSKMHNRRATLIVKEMESEDVAAPDANGVTALYIASKNKIAEMMRLLLAKLDVVDVERDIAEDTFLWASEREQTHDIVQILTQKEKTRGKKGIPALNHSQCALYWAAVRGKRDLVWQLLCNTVPTPVADQRRRTAETTVKTILKGLESGDPGFTEGGRLYAQMPHARSRNDERDQEDLKATYHLILDMLQDPPLIQTSIPQTEYRMPSLEKRPIENREAAIVDFFAQKDRTGFLQRFRSVQDVIYDKGPKSIMAEARKTMQDSSFSKFRHDKVFSEDDFQLRWIHLPANTMEWMRHLTLRIYLDDQRPEDDVNAVDAFTETSWLELPDSTSRTRFMKPTCVREDPFIALYMPYLTFATQHERPTSDSRRYNELLELYKDETIHGSRTLDEAYYQFAVGTELDAAMRLRNKDQVVSRRIHGQLEGRYSWTLLRVDQLWLWVINSNTIITSSTHRVDDQQDPVITRILYDLSKKAGRGKGQRQPSTPEELTRFIVNGCVRFFDQTLDISNNQRIGTESPISIRQLYSDSINQASIEEAKLFDSFAKEKLRKENRGMRSQAPSVNNTATLLRNVKDIRDELNILKTIATYQDDVQQELGTRAASASRIILDINEMDKLTETIYEAVHATLNLEQNEIALSQSEETIQQGKTIMLFTVTTIIFLPMSFLTSLFALDIADFQHDSSGDLKYTPGWIFPLIFGVSAALWIPLMIYAFWEQIVYYFPFVIPPPFGKKIRRRQESDARTESDSIPFRLRVRIAEHRWEAAREFERRQIYDTVRKHATGYRDIHPDEEVALDQKRGNTY